MRLLLLAGGVLLTVTTNVRAGIYHPEVLGAFDIENGYAVPLSPESFLLMLGNIKELNWRPGNLNRPEPPERFLEHRKLIDERRVKGIDPLSEDEKLSFCVDLLRSSNDRDLRQALEILGVLSRSPSRDKGFLINSYYAYALRLHGAQGQQRDALARAREAHDDYPFPTRLAGLSTKQLEWYKRFEKTYHLPFLTHRVWLDEAPKAPDRAKSTLKLDPLFRSKDTGEPIRFVGESGNFEPGAIAAAEAAKLPPDALAILQQLIFWYPNDAALMWQVAEIYNAIGDVNSALQIFDLCVRDMYIDSLEAREHRSLVKERVEWIQAETLRMQEEKKKADEEKKRQADEEKRQRYVLVCVILALVLLALLYYQTREVRRRFWNWRKRDPQQTPSVE
jgi:hypothetical protein